MAILVHQNLVFAVVGDGGQLGHIGELNFLKFVGDFQRVGVVLRLESWQGHEVVSGQVGGDRPAEHFPAKRRDLCVQGVHKRTGRFQGEHNECHHTSGGQGCTGVAGNDTTDGEVVDVDALDGCCRKRKPPILQVPGIDVEMDFVEGFFLEGIEFVEVAIERIGLSIRLMARTKGLCLSRNHASI